MKMHKIEMYVLDIENVGEHEVLVQLENCNFPHIFAVKETGTVDIDDWSDDHILNQMSTPVEEYRKYFE